MLRNIPGNYHKGRNFGGFGGLAKSFFPPSLFLFIFSDLNHASLQPILFNTVSYFIVTVIMQINTIQINITKESIKICSFVVSVAKFQST